MKVFTDPQITEIKNLLVAIEKNSSVTVAYGERIRVTNLQAEPVMLKMDF